MAATSENVRKEEASANIQAASAQALKDECESDLAEAIPALEAALSALNTLKVGLSLFIFYFTPQNSISYKLKFKEKLQIAQ